MFYETTSVEVEKIDNGWLLEWRVPNDEDYASVADPKMKKRTRGKEIFTNKKKLMQRLDVLLA